MSAALQVSGLSPGYSGFRIVDGLDLDLAAGRITAIVGSNGAGKSTLLKALAGLVPRVHLYGPHNAAAHPLALGSALYLRSSIKQGVNRYSGLPVKRLYAGAELVRRITGAKLVIFNGPVLSPSDPPYRDVHVPRAFWKIVAFARKNKSLSASAYLLSQRDLMKGDLNESIYGDWNGFQVPIARIERLTGLGLRHLAKHDAYGSEESVDVGVPIRSYGDLRL